MMADIVTRIHNYGLGQENKARQVLRAARQEVAYWSSGDAEGLPASFREGVAVRQRQFLADAEAAVQPMLQRAAEAEKDLFLYRPDVEAMDPSFRSDRAVDQLYRDALRANLVTPVIT
jgi:hypothetical protein